MCKAKDPEKQKELLICREFANYRQASLERIITDEGKLLRVNRSIQAEGAFVQLKHNCGFMRFSNRWKLEGVQRNVLLGTFSKHPEVHIQV